MSGKSHHEDYERFVPQIEAAMAAQALWDDIKFDAKHAVDIERIVMVGDKQWEKWMATICKPFTSATIKYFDAAERDGAWAWVTA